MKHILFLLCLIPQPGKAISQTVKLDALINAYQSKSLSGALTHLGKISSFKGKLYPGINSTDSSIRGVIGKDSLRARKQRGKISIYSIFNNPGEFEYLKKLSLKTLYTQEVYTRESNGINREHYVFSNVRKMKKGDLQLIITRSRDIIDNKVYYQLDLVVND